MVNRQCCKDIANFYYVKTDFILHIWHLAKKCTETDTLKCLHSLSVNKNVR